MFTLTHSTNVKFKAVVTYESRVGSNNSSKPNLLRYAKYMAEKACHVFGSTTQVGLTQALGMLGKIMTIRGVDWTLVSLVGLVFAAVAFERGIAPAAWVTASLIYMIALLAFALFGLVAVTTRTRLDRWSWLAALYAAIFASVAMAASFEPLKFITMLGLACGLVFGTYVAIVARRARRQ